jgi:hypothetical protein
MKKIILAGAMASLFALPVNAAPNCASIAQVIELLTLGYGESVAASGLDERGALIQMWVNPETGSWTVTGTGPSGTSCVLAQGEGGNHFAPEPNV